MNEDRCVVCGSTIPEGRMLCYGCEYPTEPSFSVAKITVLLRGFKDILKFSSLCSKCGCDVVVSVGRYSVSAKSILGMLSIDTSKPLMVEFYGDVPREIQKRMKRFIID